MADDAGRPHRTWPERLAIFGTFLTAFLCFAIAAALVGSYLVVRQRNIARLENPAAVAAAAAAAEDAAGGADERGDDPAPDAPSTVRPTTTRPTSPATASSASIDSTEPTATTDTQQDDAAGAPDATFPEADPRARNFLITGADNGACIDPDSPYFGAFGDRAGMGERSDTIMILRVDPDAERVAVLSFPRDLYVEVAGAGNMSRINSAYRRDEPQRLADTIFDNFGVPIDHYIQVDFCAFKTLVDAVGGVDVPFEYPARDRNTGLNVPETGCFELDGEHALAYVRSRHYQYEDPPGSGNWQSDPSSDRGRISRQQDFLRRTLSSILHEGPLTPRVARGLIRAATRYVVTDANLTPARMMEFAGVMNDVDPAAVLNYQIEAKGRMIGGADVLVPNIDGENMRLVIGLFKGEISLADAPVQKFEETTTAPPRGTATTAPVTSTSPPDGSAAATTAPAPVVETTVEESSVESTMPDTTAAESTLPAPGPQENQFGIVPPRDVRC